MQQITKIFLACTLVLTMLTGATVAFANVEGDRPSERAPSERDPSHGGEGRRGTGGEVTLVGAGTLTLLNRDGESISISTDAETTIYLVESGAEGRFSDIAVGDQIRARGQRNEDGTISAKRIVVQPDGDKAGGKVTAVEGTIITVEGRRHMSETVISTITTDAATQFRHGDATVTLTEVTTQTRLTAYGTLQADGSLSATLVLIRDRENGRPGHNGGGHALRDILDRDAIKAVIAVTLNMSVEELEAAKAEGKSLATIAAEQGVAVEDVEAAAKAEAIAQVNQAVTDSEITQEEADELIARIEAGSFPWGHGGHSHDHNADEGSEPDETTEPDEATATEEATKAETSATAPLVVEMANVLFLPVALGN